MEFMIIYGEYGINCRQKRREKVNGVMYVICRERGWKGYNKGQTNIGRLENK